MPEFIGMHEFSSTLTNLVFVIVGVIIYRRARFTGVATAILGIASAGWHWTMAPFWHTADLVMMYFMLLSLIDFSTGEQNTRWAAGVGVAMIGIRSEERRVGKEGSSWDLQAVYDDESRSILS